ncbi:MAG: fasciclin protein [Ferruginibacter sp.]|nr:fasciclin protein [Ferruginibacter sp.]
MKLMKYKFMLTCCLAICSVVMFTGCDDKADVAPVGDNIDKLISANTDLSIFQAALVKTRLDQFTKGGGPFTIFAPTNAAFNAIGINSATDLALLDSNALVQLITYHIQSVSRSFTEIPLGPNATMSTIGGGVQYGARYTDGRAYINGARITNSGGTAASNGFLYIVDRVLVPGTLSASAALTASGNYKLMLQAMAKTAVSNTTNPLTIFAVPNSVMIAAGYDSTTIANIGTTGVPFTTLKAIMQYHTVAQRIFSPNFKAGALKTVQGTNVTITTGTTVMVKGTNNPAPFSIVVPDVITTTGVIHGINGLLKP